MVETAIKNLRRKLEESKCTARIESKPGEGTCVRLYFRRAEGPEETEEAQTETRRKAARRRTVSARRTAPRLAMVRDLWRRGRPAAAPSHATR